MERKADDIQYDGELIISEGRSRKATSWKRKTMRWGDLLHRLSDPVRTNETLAEYAAMDRTRRGEIKDVGGFVGGVVKDGGRKAANIAYRTLLTLDVDYGQLGLWDDACLLMGNAACMHTTHSHTEASPRFRLLWPLGRPVTPPEYEAIGRMVASWLGIEAFDDTTYEPNRLMYLPSVSKDAEYVFEMLDGPWLDPDAVLAEYVDWQDMSSWPTSSRTTRQREARAKKQGDPRDRPGIVGAFCRVYDVPAAIDAFLAETYSPCGENRYTYAGGSTSGGLVVYDGGDFAYSHHDTDPAGGRLCNAFDLVRIHRYGEQDVDTEEYMPHKAPSFTAMKRMCNELPDVLRELESRIRETAHKDFGQTHSTLGRYAADYTEQGNAVRFADTYGNVLRYQRNLGWLFWDGMRWEKEAKEEAVLLGMRFADTLLEEAIGALQTAASDAEKSGAKAAYAWAKRSRSMSKVENMLKLATPLVNEKTPEAFDPDPWLLNTPAGIVNLRTGMLGPHDPDKRCTMLCAVEPGNGEGELWSGMLVRLTNGSSAFAKYLQTAAGMAAVGEVYEEGMIISFGPGGNGKSTFFGALVHVLGDYAGTIRPELLMAKANGQEAFGLEQVYRKRLVVAAETDEGAKLSVSVMKRLTSRDAVNVNPKHRDPFTFIPTHTLVLHTNHLPRLRSLDEGTKRRMAVAPFTKAIPGDAVITDFGRKLVEQEGGIILSWIIRGAQLFWEAERKLEKPEEVKQATQEYFQGEDWFGNFLEERCEVGDDFSERAGELYAAYKAWADLNGEYVRRGNDFAKELERRGFDKEKKKTGAKWWGLRVADSGEL